jgi:hypothetical protein
LKKNSSLWGSGERLYLSSYNIAKLAILNKGLWVSG